MATIAAQEGGRSLGIAPAASPVRGRDRRLDAIREKVDRGERLTLDDGDLLYTTPDIWGVCEMAAMVRNRLHGAPGEGGVAYYNINRHLNYSNVCALSCKFCEFYRKKDEPGAYTRDMAYVREEVRKAVEGGATEIHSVGGLHPYLPWSYYPELVSTIRDEARRLGSELHVKAFTAVEVVHLARIAKVYKGASDASEVGRAARREGIRWVLSELKKAGLGSLPGGGAEVFDDRVHDEAFKGKIRSDVWLDVHREAHALGLNTNATILYGHIEQRRERLVHMEMLRDAQDEALSEVARHSVPGEEPHEDADSAGTECRPTKGRFQTIIPLPFFPDGSDLEHLPGPTGLENLRTLAIARLMLDNFAHVKAFWIMQTLPMAQLMLQCGADDLDGTVVWYDITKVPQGSKDAATHQEVNVWTLQKAIRDAGFEPVERDTLYRRVVRDGKGWRVGV
ncbi:MAG: CofH family radical SAM protein [Phycisphaeraceae bacterium]|nr:CofH family radical SAM protein [Phycisphaeraceae bacterium]